MSADSEEMISQARRTRARANQLVAAVHHGLYGWREGSEAWQRLMSWAREVRADSRNHRHVALMRRALRKMAQPRGGSIR